MPSAENVLAVLIVALKNRTAAVLEWTGMIVETVFTVGENKPG